MCFLCYRKQEPDYYPTISNTSIEAPVDISIDTNVDNIYIDECVDKSQLSSHLVNLDILSPESEKSSENSYEFVDIKNN